MPSQTVITVSHENLQFAQGWIDDIIIPALENLDIVVKQTQVVQTDLGKGVVVSISGIPEAKRAYVKRALTQPHGRRQAPFAEQQITFT